VLLVHARNVCDVCWRLEEVGAVEGAKPYLYLDRIALRLHTQQTTHRIVVLFILFIRCISRRRDPNAALGLNSPFIGLLAGNVGARRGAWFLFQNTIGMTVIVPI
jgi:hypothetical protein